MPVTKILRYNQNENNPVAFNEAVEILRKGGLVAFPTETVYGLGADAMNEEAVKKVFEVKGRPSNNPMIVHISSLENAMKYSEDISEKGIQLIQKFWPGPLTIVTKRKQEVPDIVTAKLNTVALRMPNHPATLELLKQFEGGIVGPSANKSGKPSTTTAEHVIQDLNGMIDLIIDAGPTAIGLESTVIDVTIDPPVILRAGGLSREKIEAEIGKIGKLKEKEMLKRSPGTHHRHYAPDASVVLFAKGNSKHYKQLIKKYRDEKKIIGSITYSKTIEDIEPSPLHFMFRPSIDYIAKNLFGALRELDQQGVDVILVESVDEKGIGTAVMDRLRKSAKNS